jgi:hypothetical protein
MVLSLQSSPSSGRCGGAALLAVILLIGAHNSAAHSRDHESQEL